MLYLVILILLAYLIYKYDFKRSVHNKTIWFYIVFLIFVLLAGLRYRIGFDTIAYEYEYNNMRSFSKLTLDYLLYESRFEYGYTILIALFKQFNASYYIFQFAEALFINYAYFKFAKKYTKNQFLFLFLYFFLNFYEINCEIVRQGICVGIFLLSYDYLISSKYIKFIIAILFASLFHQVTLVLLILPILKITRVWTRIRPNIFIVCILIFLIVIGFRLQSYFNDYIMMLEIGGRVGGKLDYYTNDYRSSDIVQGYRITTVIAYLYSYVLFSFWALRRLKSSNYAYFEEICPLVIICCFCNVIGVAIFYRLTAFMWPFFILAISESIFDVRLVNGKTRHCFNIIFFVIFSIFLVYKGNRYFAIDVPGTDLHMYSRFFPYSSVIEKSKDAERERLLQY